MNPHGSSELRTARLLLRPLIASDASWIETWAGDLEVAKTTRLPHPYPPGLSQAFVERQATARGKELNFAIERLSDATPMGVIGFVRLDAAWSGEMGYWLGRPFWGQGYGAEAAGALVHFGFATLRLHKISASAVHTNSASIRILERLGFVLEGVLREESLRFGAVYDVHMFGKLHSARNEAGESKANVPS